MHRHTAPAPDLAAALDALAALAGSPIAQLVIGVAILGAATGALTGAWR